MRVAHMDSGLGNQMLDYAEYLAIRKMNPDEPCYLETIIYEIPDNVPGMFSQWNGYELERIFGINPPNIKELFDEDAWNRIVSKVQNSGFWNKNWNFAPVIVDAINDEGYNISNMCGYNSYVPQKSDTIQAKVRDGVTSFFRTGIGYSVKRITKKIIQNRLIEKENLKYDIFKKYPSNVYIGHSFRFKYKGFGIERIDQEIREAFRFPEISDKKNKAILEKIKHCNSVSIHARRSDLLFINWYCYRYGFFRRSVKYIKKHVADPEFFFFTDEKSCGWCQENENIFGLDFKRDRVYFVDWNIGEDSYRDMQLMAECKHNIFTESTFGFWGAYLNRNPDKITCAPDPTILATHTF